MPPSQPVPPGPIVDGISNEMPALFGELESVTEEVSTIRDQLVGHDKQLVVLGDERDSIVESIRDVVQELASVKTELQQYRSEIGSNQTEVQQNKAEIQRLESSLRRQRANHDQVLATVERRLGDVLTEFDSTQLTDSNR